MPKFSTITDTIYTYRFIKLLTTPFEETKAYQLGLIDKNGNRTNKHINNMEERAALTPFEETKAFKLGLIDKNGNRTNKHINNMEERAALTPFHKLVFSIRKLMAVAPGGRSKLASYAAAWYLIKDNFKLKESSLQKIINKSGIDDFGHLIEDVEWNKNDKGQLRRGSYRLMFERLDNTNYNKINKNEKVRVLEDTDPIGSIFGINIYEVTHINSNKRLYVTSGELTK